MIKEFLLKQMIQSRLKGLPQAEQDKLLTMVSKNPDFFVKIAGEIKAKMGDGKSEMDSAMEVMMSHQNELKELMK